MLPVILDNRHVEMASCQPYTEVRRIKSMENINDTIAKSTSDLPGCSAVSQATEPPHTPSLPIELLI